MVQHIVEQGAAKLAVPLGSAGRSHSLARLSGLRASPGWHVSGEAVREWRFEGFSLLPDGPCLFGAEVGGITLADALELPLERAMPLLGRLAEALGTLADRAVPFFPLQSDAVVLDDRGGVLFLPPEAMREIREVKPFAENRDTFETLNHPDLRGEALASFTLGVCVYRAAVGRFPFTANSKAAVVGETAGFVKIVADKKYGEILGVHMIGPHVTELLSGVTALMHSEAGIDELARTIHPHPTLSEAIHEAALAAGEGSIHI